MWYVDTDNALGGARGDVDDGFALVALLLAGAPLLGIGAVAGNTSAENAFKNTKKLASLCQWSGVVVDEKEVVSFLATQKSCFSILSLGPLTNIARALDEIPGIEERVERIVVVGGNTASYGRWPPFFPFEYNLTLDKQAFVRVFTSSIPIDVVPLNVACRLRMDKYLLGSLHGEIGAYLATSSYRWLKRSRLLWWRSSVAVWDLVAALYVCGEALFTTATVSGKAHRSGWLEFGDGGRELTLLVDYDPDLLWKRFISILKG